MSAQTEEEDPVPMVGQRVQYNLPDQEPQQGVVAHVSDDGKMSFVFQCSPNGVPLTKEAPDAVSLSAITQYFEHPSVDATEGQLFEILMGQSKAFEEFQHGLGKFDEKNKQQDQDKYTQRLADKSDPIHEARLLAGTQEAAAWLLADAQRASGREQKRLAAAKANSIISQMDHCLKDEWVETPQAIVTALLGITPSDAETARYVLEDELQAHADEMYHLS